MKLAIALFLGILIGASGKFIYIAHADDGLTERYASALAACMNGGSFGINGMFVLCYPTEVSGSDE